MSNSLPAFVFPGQGAQKTGMGRSFAQDFPDTAGRIFEQADEILGFPLSRICFEGTSEELGQTEITQPAIFTTSVAILTVLTDLGQGAEAVAGHSVGEYAALVASRALKFEEALPVVRLRGELMAAAADRTPGSMAAIIGLSLEQVREICAQAAELGVVEPSNLNAPTQIVVSGETEAVLAAISAAKDMGGRAVRLDVSAPFHCSLMEPVRQDLAPALRELEIVDPLIPVVANATARYVSTAPEIRQALLAQVVAPVLWADSVRLLVDGGCQSFLEIGPGKVLSGLIRSIDSSVLTRTCSVPGDIEQIIGE